jgi:hypothetical protein
MNIIDQLLDSNLLNLGIVLVIVFSVGSDLISTALEDRFNKLQSKSNQVKVNYLDFLYESTFLYESATLAYLNDVQISELNLPYKSIFTKNSDFNYELIKKNNSIKSLLNNKLESYFSQKQEKLSISRQNSYNLLKEYFYELMERHERLLIKKLIEFTIAKITLSAKSFVNKLLIDISNLNEVEKRRFYDLVNLHQIALIRNNDKNNPLYPPSGTFLFNKYNS